MLSEYPIDVMLLATDLDVARDFYGRKLGLEILLDNDQFVTFSCGGDSRLVVTKSWLEPVATTTCSASTWRPRLPTSVRAASRFLTYPTSTPSMASPMSASRSRLGSSILIGTPSAFSSLRRPDRRPSLLGLPSPPTCAASPNLAKS